MPQARWVLRHFRCFRIGWRSRVPPRLSDRRVTDIRPSAGSQWSCLESLRSLWVAWDEPFKPAHRVSAGSARCRNDRVALCFRDRTSRSSHSRSGPVCPSLALTDTSGHILSWWCCPVWRVSFLSVSTHFLMFPRHNGITSLPELHLSRSADSAIQPQLLSLCDNPYPQLISKKRRRRSPASSWCPVFSGLLRGVDNSFPHVTAARTRPVAHHVKILIVSSAKRFVK